MRERPDGKRKARSAQWGIAGSGLPCYAFSSRCFFFPSTTAPSVTQLPPSEKPTSYLAEIDPAYGEAALERMRAAVKGNGVKTDAVKLKKFEGAMLEFIATTQLQLRSRIHEKIVAGKVTGPEKVAGAQGVRDAVEKDLSRITHSIDVPLRIKDVVLERPDKGIGVQNEIIKLPFLYHDFVYHDPCPTCRGQGEIKCQRCHAKGYEICPRCNGQGHETCSQCRGAKQIAEPRGGVRPCYRCNGHGRTPCSYCNQTRRVQCPLCKKKGANPCKLCNGHAWNSHVATVEIDAAAFFDYERHALPEKIVATIDTLGRELPLHSIVAPIIVERQQQVKGRIVLPHLIRAPYGDIVFTIRGEEVPGFLFGTQGLMTDMPFFLEKLIAPGTATLEKAARGQGDVGKNLHLAARYKTIRQAVLAAARFPERKAVKVLLKATPMGLGETAAQKLVADAHQALAYISRKPLRNGFIAGMVLSAILYGAYFYGPLRTLALNEVPRAMFHPGIDFLCFVVGAGIAFIVMKQVVVSSLRKALKGFVPQGQSESFAAKEGNLGFILIGVCAVIFMALIESTMHTGGIVPAWYAQLRP
jgi:hypothetical protein